jgi:polygalacturonase
MPCTPQTWSDNNPSYPASAARMTVIEQGIQTAQATAETVTTSPVRPNTAGNGTTDDSTVINAALSALNSAGGGEVYLKPGTYGLGSPLVLYDNVYIRGAGKGSTILKVLNGANITALKTQNFDSLTGTNSTSGPQRFGVSHLTIDGNKANNLTSGHGVQIYGKDFTFFDFDIKNCRQKGWYSEWYLGGDTMECRVWGFKIFDCGDIGMDVAGPHDSVSSNGQVIRPSGTYGIRTGGSYVIYTDIHAWGGNYATSWKIDGAGCFLQVTT